MTNLSYTPQQLRQPSARLLLLIKFKQPSPIDDFTRYNDWQNALGEPVEVVVEGLVQDGLLIEGSLADRLSYRFRVSDLKDLLRERAMPVSGKKEALVSRLVENCGDAMEPYVRWVRVFMCSAAGRHLADAYLDEQHRWRLETEANTRSLLQARQFREAAAAVAAYEAQQLFKRGIGIDWSSKDFSFDVAVMQSLFERVPQFLGPVDKEPLEQLRLAAGLYYLWSDPLEPFPSEFDTNFQIPKEQLAANLWYAAKFQIELAEMKDSGVEWVGISGCNDAYVCPACAKLHAKRHRIDKVPELPYAGCTSALGCRCVAGVWFDD